MGQLIEFPEIITEGKNLEDCRLSLRDTLKQMLIAYQQQNKQIPLLNHLSRDTNLMIVPEKSL